MEATIRFDDPKSAERALVGGKAASLGKLTQAGFPVPPGFSVTTGLYAEFLAENGLDDEIRSRLGDLDYGDAERLEAQTAEIRALITGAPAAANADEAILAAYHELGGDGYVAVRSSGTAEDMAEASFAGLHDTYLDIRGDDEVVDAVRRCWASLWTARVVSYRQNAGLDHNEALISVVVQKMVSSDVAGVLFTANPLNDRTDQIVVNASWGLGEGIVSGILTPDEFIVDAKRDRVAERTLGSKQLEVVRAPDGRGTVTEPVPEERQAAWTLDDSRVLELARLGRRVSDYYDGLPQDLEWALAGGELYLLQSRDVTGAEFTWDEDLEAWQSEPDDENTVWSHTWAEAYWTGAVSPVFYSVRARELRDSDQDLFGLWGFDDLKGMRRFKYRRGTVYFSSTADRLYYRYILPPALRHSTVQNLPPEWREEAAAAPFDWVKAAKMHLRIATRARGRGPNGFMKSVYELIEKGSEEAGGPSRAELRTMSDAEVRRNLEHKMGLARRFLTLLRPGFHVYGAGAFGTLNWMLASWYDGDNAYAFQDVISGLPQRTVMVEEQLAMHRVTEAIRTSEHLTRLLSENGGAEFFEACDRDDEGRRFLELYRRELLEPHGHRGHADRDIWYSRRFEDPGLDVQALRLQVSAGQMPSPEETECRLIEKREQATAEVVANIRSGRVGALKARLFGAVLDYAHRFLVLRDDERHYIDRITVAKKISLQEIGRRMAERGQLERDDDFYFLSLEELDEVQAGTASMLLIRQKIAGRRKVFDRYNARQESPPDYLEGDSPSSLGATDEEEDGTTMRGAGTSRGSITGRARIVPELGQIGRLEKGDILICNGTDPGWASAFTLISGLILEHGGMLAHGACLSREYGLPAVTLPKAMQRISDGATITVNGDTGEVSVEQETDGAEVDREEVPA